MIKTLTPLGPSTLTETLDPEGIPARVPLMEYWPGVATKLTPFVVWADPTVTVRDGVIRQWLVTIGVSV